MTRAHADVRDPGDPFIGRAPELEAIGAAFASGRWLVTLVGTGGIGKTRLAAHYAATRARRPATRCALYLVALEQTRSLDALVAAVAAALDVALGAERPGVEQLGDALAQLGDVVLVLDNVEQIIDETASAVQAWRLAAPAARFLVTSRMALGLAGEQRIAVPPLPLDDGCALFESRARAVDHRFALSDSDRALLAQLIERLDGIPLAIELAAARASLLAMSELCARLHDDLSWLRATRRDVAPRQATLRATIEWSWNLLCDDERTALAQCGVFRGGFSLAGAEAVVRVEARPVIDVVQSLCEHSLLRIDHTGRTPRYRLFEPIREFAEAQLVDRGEVEATRARHAAFCERIAAPLARVGALYGACDVAAVDAAGAELDNLVVAMQRAAPATAARIGLALAGLLHMRGPRQRCLRIVAAAVEAAEQSGDRGLACSALIVQAQCRRQWGWRDGLDSDAQRALALAERLGDAELESYARYDVAMVALERGAFADAEDELARALDIFAARGDVLGEGLAEEGRALLDGWSARYREAEQHHARALAASRAAGNRRWEAVTLRNRAVLYHQQGHAERALRDTRTALDIQDDLRDPHALLTLANAIEMAAQLGDLALARSFAGRALDRVRRGDSAPRLGDPYLPAAWVHVADGDLRAAEALLDEGLDWRARFSCDRTSPQAWIARGVVRLLRGRAEAARDDLATALAGCNRDLPLVTDACLAAAFLAAAELACGRPQRAWPAFALARAEARRWGLPRFARTLRALEPCFGLPETARAADDPTSFLEEIGARAVAARMRAIDPGVFAAVRVGPDARWIELPDSARVDLRRRPVLRRLIGALVDARRARPGQPLSTRALVATVWPDDRSDPAALENRLWVALSAARRLGLDPIVRRDADGYLLDPAIPLREVLS